MNSFHIGFFGQNETSAKPITNERIVLSEYIKPVNLDKIGDVNSGNGINIRGNYTDYQLSIDPLQAEIFRNNETLKAYLQNHPKKEQLLNHEITVICRVRAVNNLVRAVIKRTDASVSYAISKVNGKTLIELCNTDGVHKPLGWIGPRAPDALIDPEFCEGRSVIFGNKNGYKVTGHTFKNLNGVQLITTKEIDGFIENGAEKELVEIKTIAAGAKFNVDVSIGKNVILAGFSKVLLLHVNMARTMLAKVSIIDDIRLYDSKNLRTICPAIIERILKEFIEFVESSQSAEGTIAIQNGIMYLENKRQDIRKKYQFPPEIVNPTLKNDRSFFHRFHASCKPLYLVDTGFINDQKYKITVSTVADVQTVEDFQKNGLSPYRSPPCFVIVATADDLPENVRLHLEKNNIQLINAAQHILSYHTTLSECNMQI